MATGRLLLGPSPTRSSRRDAVGPAAGLLLAPTSLVLPRASLGECRLLLSDQLYHEQSVHAYPPMTTSSCIEVRHSQMEQTHLSSDLGLALWGTAAFSCPWSSGTAAQMPTDFPSRFGVCRMMVNITAAPRKKASICGIHPPSSVCSTQGRDSTRHASFAGVIFTVL